MAKVQVFDRLIPQQVRHWILLFRQQFEQVPDHRKRDNITYKISDAVLGAFAVFFT